MALRIEVKTDAESTIGRGAILRREHFQPPMVQLIVGMIQAVEANLPHAEILKITEGERPAMHPRDLHAERKAFDFTIRFPHDARPLMSEYIKVAEACRAIVGDADYDFLVHGVGDAQHIHAEYDPKPKTGVA